MAITHCTICCKFRSKFGSIAEFLTQCVPLAFFANDPLRLLSYGLLMAQHVVLNEISASSVDALSTITGITANFLNDLEYVLQSCVVKTNC